jgi:hypothetical protein
VTTTYLAPLTRPELDTLTREAEHAEAKAMLVFRMVPLDHPASIARLHDAAGVAQDCRAWVTDCYEASFALSAAEMDRVFGSG